MLFPVSMSDLAANLNELLEKVLRTGEPLEVDYKGEKLIIYTEKQETKQKSDKFSRLKSHPDCLTGNPEDIVHMDWTRDPFDRIIVGHAAVTESSIVTKDQLIRENYTQAIW